MYTVLLITNYNRHIIISISTITVFFYVRVFSILLLTSVFHHFSVLSKYQSFVMFVSFFIIFRGGKFISFNISFMRRKCVSISLGERVQRSEPYKTYYILVRRGIACKAVLLKAEIPKSKKVRRHLGLTSSTSSLDMQKNSIIKSIAG